MDHIFGDLKGYFIRIYLELQSVLG